MIIWLSPNMYIKESRDNCCFLLKYFVQIRDKEIDTEKYINKKEAIELIDTYLACLPHLSYWGFSYFGVETLLGDKLFVYKQNENDRHFDIRITNSESLFSKG